MLRGCYAETDHVIIQLNQTRALLHKLPYMRCVAVPVRNRTAPQRTASGVKEPSVYAQAACSCHRELDDHLSDRACMYTSPSTLHISRICRENQLHSGTMIARLKEINHPPQHINDFNHAGPPSRSPWQQWLQLLHGWPATLRLRIYIRDGRR